MIHTLTKVTNHQVDLVEADALMSVEGSTVLYFQSPAYNFISPVEISKADPTKLEPKENDNLLCKCGCDNFTLSLRNGQVTGKCVNCGAEDTVGY